MKKTILLISVLLIASISQAQTLQSLIEKYSENEHFEYVFLGGGGPTGASVYGNVAKVKGANSKTESTKILTLTAATNSTIMKAFEKDLNAVLEAGKFETTLETHSKGESTCMYHRSLGNGNEDDLIVTKTKTEISVMWTSGKSKNKKTSGLTIVPDEVVLDEANLDTH
jgi:hypothetical protein